MNPTGNFELGGPHADCGLTGRKIIVDTYGGMARHGGGAFSGKDPTKVDRSAAYAVRQIAKAVVASGLARRCEAQVAYAIGVAHPVSIMVDTFGTSEIADDKLEVMVRDVFDMRPAAIIERLDLRRPIYRRTAAYGHFGRSGGDGFTWENVRAVRRRAAPRRGLSQPKPVTRVVRVLPDVTAVDRAFDYTIDVDVPVGTIVRVPLHGPARARLDRRRRRRAGGRVAARGRRRRVRGPAARCRRADANGSRTVGAARAWRSCAARRAPNIVLPLPVCAASAPHRGARRTNGVPGRAAAAVGRPARRGGCAVRGRGLDDRGGRRRGPGPLAGVVPLRTGARGRGACTRSTPTPRAPRRGAAPRPATASWSAVASRRSRRCPTCAPRSSSTTPTKRCKKSARPRGTRATCLQERAARAGAPFTVFSPAPTVEALDAADVIDAPAADVERRGLAARARRRPAHRAAGRGVAERGARRGVARRRRTARSAFSTGAVASVSLCARRARTCCVGSRPTIARRVPRVRVDQAARAAVRREAGARGARGADPRVARRRRRRRDRERARRRHRDRDRSRAAPFGGAAPPAHARRVSRSRSGVAGAALPRRRASALARDARRAAARGAAPCRRRCSLLQTRMPDHTVVQAVQDGFPAMVADAELEYRRVLGYPPFGALAELSGEDDAVRATVDALRTTSGRAAGVQVFGPNDDHALVIAPTGMRSPTRWCRRSRRGRKHGRVRAAVDPPRT